MHRGWVIGVVLAAAARLAHADVNLLTAGPTVVAVSSTVANATFLPAHLVDGNPQTAWNSRTDDLVGAWIAVRVPDGAHISAVKLTVGFTHIEGAQDWFTMNPRVRRVRITSGDEVRVERDLDPTNRGLQTIAVASDLGELKIEILDVVPGSKSSWHEACVSELEVWGTLKSGTVAIASKPTVRVGSLAEAIARRPPVAPSTLPAVLLVLPSADHAITTIVLGQAPASFVPAGELALFAPPRAYESNHDAVVLQPIAERASGAPWTGRSLDLYDASSKPCPATITGLAVLASGYVGSDLTHLDRQAVKRLAWTNRRGDQNLLVATLDGSACSSALWARARGTRAPVTGTIEARAHRDALAKTYFTEENAGYARMYESYLLNDLDGEYGDSAANEARIPVAERLTPELVAKSLVTLVACTSKQRCVGVVSGSYGARDYPGGHAINAGVVGAHENVCGVPVAPLAAVDLDGDGEVELVYSTADGIAYFGTHGAGAAETRQQPCPWIYIPPGAAP